VTVRYRTYGSPESVILFAAAVPTAKPTALAASPENFLITVSTISPNFAAERGDTGGPAITEVASKIMIDVNINEDITAILPVTLDLIVILVVNLASFFL
jgi:hypothetical protein